LTDSEHKKHGYYDVEKFRRVVIQTSKPMGRPGRLFRRFTSVVDSMQGFFLMLLMPFLAFGVLLMIISGAFLGPWGFWVIFGGIIAGLGFVLERKVGKSIEVVDYSFLGRALATAVAFGMVLIVLFLALYLLRPGMPMFG